MKPFRGTIFWIPCAAVILWGYLSALPRSQMGPSADPGISGLRRWLWVVIYSRLGDASETEDILQEVSLAALRCRAEFRETEGAKSWLYRVAVRQVMLFRRRQYRDRAKIQNYVSSLPAVDMQTYVRWLCSDETTNQIQQALTMMRPSDQQVLALKYGEGYSCKEIAKLLGVQETTVQSRLLRARQRLKCLLINEYEFEE